MPLIPLRRLYGNTPAENFGPLALKAELLKERYPRVKYANITITETGITGHMQSYGPMM